MRRAYAFHLLVVLLAGACGLDGVDPGSVDASSGADPDADPNDPDAMFNPTSGLVFRFRARPELPTEPDGEYRIEITKAVFELQNVRAVGDAAPGDERTTRPTMLLDLAQDEVDLSFPDAPPGVYSFLIAETVTYSIEGTVTFGEGEDETQFEIEDDLSMSITLNVDLKSQSLGADLLEIPIKADVRKLPREVGWQSFSQDEEVEIGPSYNKIGDLRNKLPEVFKLDD
jgi:hypothetical protein